MNERPERCPVHGRDEPGWEWPCPAAVEGDPPDAETCPYFIEELERRIEEVRGGHYFKIEWLPDGRRVSQEYRDHQPYGEPKITQ